MEITDDRASGGWHAFFPKIQHPRGRVLTGCLILGKLVVVYYMDEWYITRH